MFAGNLLLLLFDVSLLLKERSYCLILFDLSDFASLHFLLFVAGFMDFGLKFSFVRWFPTVILFCIFGSCLVLLGRSLIFSSNKVVKLTAMSCETIELLDFDL